MATVFRDISAALDQQLSTMPSLPPVAWENQEFTPENGTLWLRATNLQGDTFGETENDRTNGIYQIDIFAPPNEGKAEVISMADAVADQFAQDSVLTYNGTSVKVRTVSRRNISNEDAWSRLIIEVVYYVFTTRR